MPHKPFHVPLRKSSVNAPTGEIHSNNNGRKDPNSRSIHKAQRILGTTDIALDHDYHRRPEKTTTTRKGYLNAPDLLTKHEVTGEGRRSPNIRVRASSPLLGQEYQDTVDSTSPLVQLTRKLHLSGSSSALYSRYSSREPRVGSSTGPGTETVPTPEPLESSDGGVNPAFKHPKGPMKDTKRKTRPPRIDLSLLFPKPQANNTPLLSPQRMVSSPSALSTTSDNSTRRPRGLEPQLPGKKLSKAPPQSRTTHRPENSPPKLDAMLDSSIPNDTTDTQWTNSSLERTVRTSEIDMALQKNFDVQLSPRSPDRSQYKQMNFSLRSRENLQRSDSKSILTAGSGESARSSQRTMRDAQPVKSSRDMPPAAFRFGLREEAPSKNPSKKSSRSTLKNTDLSHSSVLCLSSSEDEDDEEPSFPLPPRHNKNKRDSVSTYGDFEAEICTATTAHATRSTLRSVERPSSSNTQGSRSSLKPVQPRRDSIVSKSSSSTTGFPRSHRSSGNPTLPEPNFFHGDPIFDQTKAPARTPSLSQKEINRRSRLMAVTRQEERLLEVMRQRQGKITPSIFNETVEPDRRSTVSGPSRDSFYCADTSFLRLSPGIPPPGLARALQATQKLRERSTLKGAGSDFDDKTIRSAPSPRASLISSKSLPSPATSTTSPLTPTLPIHRFSPLPSQKPPPRRPPPPVPDLQRQHSRRRTDSSGVIALENATENRKESGEFPIWALGWNSEGSNMTAATHTSMRESVSRRSPAPGTAWKHASWILLTMQHTAFVLLAYYSRIMPPTGGKRYLTSTAVFFNEVVKLAISLTVALYEVSRSAPPSVPATSLLSSLTTAVFSGDSWKLAIPASLYTLASSLQYIALSNLQAATFQVSYQLKIFVSSIFGLILLGRSITPRKWGLLLVLLVGVGLVQIPNARPDELSLENTAAHFDFPRSLDEWRSVKLEGGNLHKRSATYEGIEEDILTATPRLNGGVGVLATLGACAASGLAGVYFEKVLKDSAKHTSLWVRNVQLAIYSIFPALFIGVVFLDGETIANGGILDGYNWVVWSTIIIQAFGGIAASFCVGPVNADTKNVASATSIILTSLGSVWLFEFELTITYLVGTFAVLVATYLCETPSVGKRQGPRPPPIRVERFEKGRESDQSSPTSSHKEISIKLPTTPFLDAGISTSRPTSPGVTRSGSSRASGGAYF
ncbi:nucleotide-sugar transporter-domain-containing protein [Aspergillus granulosus]|uniref:Nucleotide-sugar transporter-domain-containing protein n=1 Tax=Aspergillus granulosus TaxID=176169 RepID=A0ABR4H371_9EURO